MNNNLFGTDGIRSIINTGCFTDDTITSVAHALSSWLTYKYGSSAHVLIGHDTRNSCSWIKHTLIGILNRHGHSTYDAGIASTPALCWLTTHTKQFHCTIIISASHNAWNYNGIKIYDRNTGKITPFDEEYITNAYYTKLIKEFDAHTLASNTVYFEGITVYKQAVISLFKKNFLHHIKIVLDCAHGATLYTAYDIFKECGATVIMINNSPDGKNINFGCGATDTRSLQKSIQDHNADIGFAFDGDGDRVIAVNKDGTIKDGDDILALLSFHPLYKNSLAVVTTSMANYGLEHYLKKNHIQLMYVDVGDKYVSQALIHNNLLLGGEQSGHIIMTDFLPTGDGIFTALRIMETLLIMDNISFKTFEKWPQVLMNIPAQVKKDIESQEIQTLIKKHYTLLQKGRILVRYSGTEPLLRIMVEGADADIAVSICTQLSKDFSSLLKC